MNIYIANEHELRIGQTFNNYEELKKAFNEFCKENYHPFVIRTRSDKQIVYKCSHGIKPISRFRVKRPNWRYYYKGCEAQINLYKSKNNEWRITRMSLNHNHEIGRDEFIQYSRSRKLSYDSDLFLADSKDAVSECLRSFEEKYDLDSELSSRNTKINREIKKDSSFVVEEVINISLNNTEFCNICLKMDNLKNIYMKENEQLKHILISIIPHNDLIKKNCVYLCSCCCKKLEDFELFRKQCYENLIVFPEQYKHVKQKLEECNDPDILKKLKSFVSAKLFGITDTCTPQNENSEGSVYSKNYSGCNIETNEVSINNIKTEVNSNDSVYVQDHVTVDLQENNLNSVSIKEEWNKSMHNRESNSHNLSETVPAHNMTSCKNEQSDTANMGNHRVPISSPVQRMPVDGKPFKCDLCNRCFSRMDTLYKHKRAHAKEKHYKCDICEKVFSCASYLSIHKRVHTGEKPYKCDVCEKCFSASNNLTLHKRVHTGEKPYKCDLCGKCFSQLNVLAAHKRTHTGERPFHCEICEKTFTQVSNLSAHKRLHREETVADMCEVILSV